MSDAVMLKFGFEFAIAVVGAVLWVSSLAVQFVTKNVGFGRVVGDADGMLVKCKLSGYVVGCREHMYG